MRGLAKSDAFEYRALRLRALKEHPTAFSSSYEQQKDWPLETFAQRLLTTLDSADSFILSCFVEKKLIGTIGFYREKEPKRMHVGVIFGMRVAAEQQGRGYGQALLGATLGRAHHMPALALIHLSVESTNDPAKSLYVSFSFQTYGVERQAIFVDGEYFDEELMALNLDLPAGLFSRSSC